MDLTPSAASAPARRRVTAIVNPATRRAAGDAIDALGRAAPSGVDLEILVTTAPGEGVRLARDAVARSNVLVAVGGDGTVADVATALYGRSVPLGIVPVGSTNIVARDLAIPTDLRAAADLIFGRHGFTTLDVGRCGDRSFLHMAGAGLDSRFFASTNRNLKRRLGWLAYLPSAAVSLRHPPARFTILADDRTIEVTSPLVLVANGASVIAPGLRLHPAISATDGWLDLLVFTATTPLPVARTLASLATLRLAGSPFLVTTKARRIEVAADPPLPLQLDGDVVAQTPAVFTLDPAALPIIVPPRPLP